MKIAFLILALLSFSSCSSQTASLKVENTIQPNPTIGNISGTPYPEEKSDIGAEERFAIGRQNQEFRSVPGEFKRTDFKNFRFPVYRDSKIIQEFIRLKNGACELEDKHSGGTNYEFGDVFLHRFDG